MPHLPPRPYVVAPSFVRRSLLVAFGLTLVGLAGVGGGSWWLVHSAKIIARDQAIWDSGRDGLAVRVSGKSTSHSFIINDYDLDVTFVDPTGLQHGGKSEFALFVASIDDSDPIDLKYDPADPSRFVLSSVIEHRVARWGQVLFMSLIGIVLFGVGMLALAWKKVSAVADARRVAERSDEVLLELVSTKPVVMRGKHVSNIYVFRHGAFQRKQTLPIDQQPLFSDDKRTHLVALVSPSAPHRPWIMRHDYLPFYVP